MRLRWLLLPLLLLPAIPALADKSSFFQGINYEPVAPRATGVKPGQVEVIEFYWYGCPVCFGLEPYVEAWEKQLPKNVVFKRVPAAWPDTEFYVDAQATAVAEILGVGAKIREPFFNAIHEQGDVALRTDKDALSDFFAKYGVSPKDFDATWNSFGVQTRLAQYQRLAASYGVDRVPTIIVNGKWKTGAGYQMAPADVMRCVQYLVDKESAPAK